ncbi:MAG: hypothetical protein ACUZ9M_00565 [Candidatus Scalindua sp.]
MPETETILGTEETQTSTTSWKDGVEKELRFSKDGTDRLARFDDSDASVMATSYLRYENSQNDRVKIPTAESGDEEKSAFYNKMGRPERADGYTMPELAEGQELDKELFNGWAAVAHESGMSDPQFTSLVNKYLELETQQRESELVEFNRYKEESIRKMHEEYGADYDKNIELSKRAYTEYANDALKELLETDKFISLRNEPSFIDMMVQMGIKNMDDTFVKGEGQTEEKKEDVGFIPNSPNSPEMYANMDNEEGVRARAWFTKKGHEY